MDELEWSECNETLEDIFKNPKVQFPQLLKLSEKITSVNCNETLEKDQVITILAKKTIAKLSGTDAKAREIRLPVDCPFRVQLKLPPGKEKEFETIEALAKNDPLPKFVEVTKVEGLESVKVGDRLKVVIAEKSGGEPSFIHFRSSSGKHVKIAVNQEISFRLAVNDASEQLLSKIAEKSRELPVAAKFLKEKNVPQMYLDFGVFNITKGFTEHVVLASANKSKSEFAVIFPLNLNVKFQVTSKLKLAKDEQYRELCSNCSNVDESEIAEYLNVVNPADDETRYVIKYKKLLKLIHSESTDTDSDSDAKKEVSMPGNVSKEEEAVLTLHTEQRDLVRKQQKEKERMAKLEKERLKAERKKEKKERKEKEKEERKKKKLLHAVNTPEMIGEDLYIVPESPSLPTSPKSPASPSGNEDSKQPQWALHLLSKVKDVKDRTKSLGRKPKKRGKLKQDTTFDSTDNLSSNPSSDYYTGLDDDDDDDAFSDSLYETLPCDMAYESLDLIAQAKRSLAPNTAESNGDSGFDEVDQAKIKAWRDSMQPPPLPGNHPHQNRIDNNNSDDIYEVAIDSASANPDNASANAWKSFYNIVEQSANEISMWSMEDVSNCLQDLKLGQYKKTFDESQVDGQLLLDLDESVLRDLGLTFFEARKLRKFVFGWRPDAIRPPNYPELKGFDSENPSDWSEKDVIAHLQVIDINDFSEFCAENQVNGDLLKDICIDETIMISIITSRDRKLKTVKIKNYVIDKWRPKKKGESHYVSYTASQKEIPQPAKSSSVNHSPVSRAASSPYSTQRNRKVSDNSTPLGIGKKVGGDAPLIARMKQQLEENKSTWENRKKVT